jgi:hypothetical protein
MEIEDLAVAKRLSAQLLTHEVADCMLLLSSQRRHGHLLGHEMKVDWI